MFDISFSELMVIGVVALVVIGPERLPKVARTAGHLLGRLQRYVNNVKSDINREMQLDELKKLQAQVEDSARSLERTLNKEVQTAQQGLQQTAQSLESSVSEVAAAVQPTAVTAAAASGDLLLAERTATTASLPGSTPPATDLSAVPRTSQAPNA